MTQVPEPIITALRAVAGAVDVTMADKPQPYLWGALTTTQHADSFPELCLAMDKCYTDIQSRRVDPEESIEPVAVSIETAWDDDEKRVRWMATFVFSADDFADGSC